MSCAKSSPVERLIDLTQQSTASGLSEETARLCIDTLRRDIADFDRFIARRFARLPRAVQATFLDIVQRAQPSALLPALQEWSRDQAVSLRLRAHALKTREQLGASIDVPYRDALLQATTTLERLLSAPEQALTETGELRSACRDAVLNLPLALALDVTRELIADHPSLALGIVQAIRSIVDTRDCQTLVETLANIPVPGAVDILQDILSHTTDKTLQKTVKKALHRLKARGLQVDVPGQETRTVVLGSVTHKLERCLASHIDAAGDRVLWMIRTKALGGYHVAYLVINYGTGIRLAMGLQATKRELPELLAKAQERVRFIEIEPTYCQHQVALAHAMNLDSHTPVPEEYFTMRDIIGESTVEYERALIYSVLSEADLREAQAYEAHAQDLLAVPEFAGWTLPMHIIQTYADMLREIEESQILVSPALKRDRVREVYARVTDEILSAHARRIMQMRLEEMAYFLLQTDRRREALWAVAAAESMHPDATPTHSNRFIEALLERSLESAKERPTSRIIQPFAQLASRSSGSSLITPP